MPLKVSKRPQDGSSPTEFIENLGKTYCSLSLPDLLPSYAHWFQEFTLLANRFLSSHAFLVAKILGGPQSQVTPTYCIRIIDLYTTLLYYTIFYICTEARPMPKTRPSLAMILLITHFVACCWFGVAAWTGLDLDALKLQA